MRFIHTRRNAFGHRAFWTHELAVLRSHWAFLATPGRTHGEFATAKEEAEELRGNFRDMIKTVRFRVADYSATIFSNMGLAARRDTEADHYWTNTVVMWEGRRDAAEALLAFYLASRDEITAGLRAWDAADRAQSKRITILLAESKVWEIKMDRVCVAQGRAGDMRYNHESAEEAQAAVNAAFVADYFAGIESENH